MSPLKQSSRGKEIRQALKDYGICTMAVLALIIGAYTLVFLRDFFTGQPFTPVAYVETEHYLAEFGP